MSGLSRSTVSSCAWKSPPILLSDDLILWHNTFRLYEEQFPPVETQHSLRRMNEITRWVVRLRCYLSSLLRIQHRDCAYCNTGEKYGVEMRKRLEELSGRMKPASSNDMEHGKAAAEVLASKADSKAGEAVARPPVSSKKRPRKEIA